MFTSETSNPGTPDSDLESPGRLNRLLGWLEERINLTEIFSFLSIYGLFYTEVDTSKPLRRALREALNKPIPSYSRWPRVLGLLVLILFLFEVGTGILLAFFYRPTTQEAYESVLIIIRDVSFGWFVRQIHIWGAQLLIVILMARLFRFFFRGLYRSPREMIWISAALLFLVTTHLDFTGRFLAWNNEVYWSSVRAMELLYSIPILGSFFSFFVPGIETQSYVLSRFYFLHVVILPVVFWLLLYMSFSGIRRVGLSQITGEESRPGKHAFQGHLYSLLILIVFFFGLLVTLSVILPTPFGTPVDFLETPQNTRIPWYLLAPYGFVEFMPAWIPLRLRSTMLLVVLLVFIFLPVLGGRIKDSPDRRKLGVAFGIVVFVLWIVFTAYGALRDTGGW